MEVYEKLKLFEEQMILYERIEKRLKKYHPFILTGIVISWILYFAPYQSANLASSVISLIVIFTAPFAVFYMHRNSKRFSFMLNLHREIVTEACQKNDLFILEKALIALNRWAYPDAL